jgi:hypothetical protein
MPQLVSTAFQSGSSLNFRWSCHAKVMKMLDRVSSRMVRYIYHE